MAFPSPSLNSAFPRERDVIRAEIATPEGRELAVYCVHLKSRGGGRMATEPRRALAAELLAEKIGSDPIKNVAVLGDFNDAPSDLSLNILESGDAQNSRGGVEGSQDHMVNLTQPLADLDYATLGLYSQYEGRDLKPIVQGTKSANEQGRGQSEDRPPRTSFFDQILVRPHLAEEADTPIVFSKRIALEGTRTRIRFISGDPEWTEFGTRASDHVPVYVDLTL